MKKIVPLGCLVVLVGPSGSGKSTLCANHFAKGEVVSSDALREELTGDFQRQDKNNEVFEEFYRRLRWRLTNGYRAVADATHLRDTDRRRTVQLAEEIGVPVYYMVVNRSIAAKNASGGWRLGVRSGKLGLIEKHDE